MFTMFSSDEERECYFLWGRYIIEIIVLYILFKYSYRRKRSDLILTNEQKEKLIRDFKPEPLVDKIYPKLLKEPPFMNSSLIELADYDFYNLKNLHKEELIDVIKKYGVGTCGPPGFYGTLDIHLELEKKISQVLGTEASILYSNSFTCINSVITCFCRQTDTVFYHKNSNEAIIRALGITKGSSVCYTNLEDLENKLKQFYQKRRRNFIITEGLFKNTGEITNMIQLIKLKNKYKTRLIVDESLSIPLLGKRGISEYFNTDIKEIDVVIGSLAHVFCGNGGFASGSLFSVEYQRLSAQSYCFSASMPGFLAKNAILNLEKSYSKINPEIFFQNFSSEKYVIVSDKKSPMIVIQKKERDVENIDNDVTELRNIKRKLLDDEIRVGVIENPCPGLRICLKKDLNQEKIIEITKSINNVCK